ncbi:hypothetical protein V8F20_012207 [Naviculisporaceae sp. PSN 640]
MTYKIPKFEATTPESRQALDHFGRELANLEKGKVAKLTKDKFIAFVRDGHYDWFAQTSDVLRARLVNYAKHNVDELKAWFSEAKQIRPEFFRHPVEHWDNGARFAPETMDLCAEFDALVELELIPPPNPSGTVQVATEEPKVLVNTHFPNPYNSIPEEVIAKRPDLFGKTREEAWLSDLDRRDMENQRFLGLIRQHLTRGVEALEVDKNPLTTTVCEWLRDFLVQLETSNPGKTFSSIYNAAQGCIAADANKAQAEALAKRLPVFRPLTGSGIDANGQGPESLNRSNGPAFELPKLPTGSPSINSAPNEDEKQPNVSMVLPSTFSRSAFEPVSTATERGQQRETPASQGSDNASQPIPTPSNSGLSRPVIIPITRSASTRGTSTGISHMAEESDNDQQRPEKRQRQD